VELIQNVTVYVVRVCWKLIYGGTGAGCYCVSCDRLVDGNIATLCNTTKNVARPTHYQQTLTFCNTYMQAFFPSGNVPNIVECYLS
jgi:hypothetical protein